MDHLLLVEDDVRIQRMLRMGLEEEGFVLDIAGSVAEARSISAGSVFDAVLLDVRLPDGSGFDVCAELRRTSPTLPILMLTALDDVPHRIQGLDAGADDYVSKPFSFEELLARIRALLRRSRAVPHHVEHCVGNLVVDTHQQQVRVGARLLNLSLTEFHLLGVMAAHPGTALSRDLLFSTVWSGREDVLPNVLDVYIGHLRRKLAEAGFSGHIETLRGTGYALHPAV